MLVSLSVAVALVAGTFFCQAASFDRSGRAIEGADPAAGVAFYAALNRTLAGEGVVDLQSMVTGDFVDHAGDAAGGRETGALIDQLTALGRTFPGIQLRVSSIQPSGDDLIVDVAPVLVEPGRIAGLMLTPARLPGGIEVLRMRRGQVSERWASALPSLATMTFQDAARSFYTDTDLSARLYRIELQPGSELGWTVDELAVVMTESGSLSMTVEKPNKIEAPVTETTAVEAGMAVSIPREARLRLRSTSVQGATLLLFAAHSLTAENPRPFRLEGGARSVLLWNSPAPFALPETARVQIGKIELPANMEITLTVTSEMEIVAGIQGGSLTVAAEDGTLLQRNETYAIVPVGSPRALAAGGMIQISQANRVDLGASPEASVSIWLVTMGPIDPEGGAFELPPGPPGR